MTPVWRQEAWYDGICMGLAICGLIFLIVWAVS